jgi:hypothetical protein
MQRSHREFLVFKPVRRDLPTFTKEDEVIGAVPIFHDL